MNLRRRLRARQSWFPFWLKDLAGFTGFFEAMNLSASITHLIVLFLFFLAYPRYIIILDIIYRLLC
jgi:hypothetical protein